MFIKLTANSGEVFFVNFDNVETFLKDNNGSLIHFVDSESALFQAKESPEEIMKLIEAAKTPIVSINDSDFEGGLQVNACCHREDSK